MATVHGHSALCMAMRSTVSSGIFKSVMAVQPYSLIPSSINSATLRWRATGKLAQFYMTSGRKIVRTEAQGLRPTLCIYPI
jgi:hypothetical protein